MSGESEFLEHNPPPKKLAVQPRLFRAPKELETEDVEAEEEEAVRLLEPVARLEAAEPAAEKIARAEAPVDGFVVEHVKPVFQPLEKPSEKALPEVAASWGESSKRSNIWMFWTGVGVLVAIVGGLAIQPWLREQRLGSQRSFFENYKVIEETATPTIESPTRYFEENADLVAQELHDTLTRYAHAKTLAEVLPLVRDGDRLRLKLLEFWRPWDTPAGWEAPTEVAMGYGSSGSLPYAFMSGAGPNFEPFHMVFVREDNRMLVDWEASEGIGTHTLEELRNPEVKDAVMRLVASPAVYYSAAFPEKKYRSFQLVARDGLDYVWGYAEIGTPVEEQLTGLFRPGVILTEQTSSEPVRLRLGRRQAGAMPNQWVILDMLHKGWVAP
jgi:hypothetical protein